MSESKWTPGPWRIDPCWDVLGNTDDGNGLVCAVTHDAVPVDEARANARLIAAAPSMYEALRRLVIEAELDGMDKRPGWDAWVSQGRAALRLAEGE